MSRITGHRFLHSPGPTRVPDEVAHAMSRQPMDLADPRVVQTIAACEAGLRRVLGTASAEVFMYAANGHGAWEAAIVNLLAPGALFHARREPSTLMRINFATTQDARFWSEFESVRSAR